MYAQAHIFREYGVQEPQQAIKSEGSSIKDVCTRLPGFNPPAMPVRILLNNPSLRAEIELEDNKRAANIKKQKFFGKETHTVLIFLLPLCL